MLLGLGEEQFFAVLTDLYCKLFSFINSQPMPTVTPLSREGAPPVAKVMRKEARHTQRRDGASGVPLEILDGKVQKVQNRARMKSFHSFFS